MSAAVTPNSFRATLFDISLLTIARNRLVRRPACAGGQLATPRQPAGSAYRVAHSTPQQAMVDDLEQRTFRWFWDGADPNTGLVPDHYPGESFSSIAAVGFGLTAYGIGVERGYITREQAVHAHAGHAEVLPRCAAERQRGRHHRLPRLLLSLPRHETRQARGPLGRAVQRRHHPAARRRAVRAVLLRPRHAAGKADPRTGRRHLPRGRLALDAGAPAADQHGLDAGRQVHPGRLEGLQRGQAGLHPGAGLAHPSGGADAWKAWPSTYDKHLGQLPRPDLPQLRAAVRPPVHRVMDRFPRHPRWLEPQARPGLLRERPPRHLQPAQLRHRQSRSAGPATARTSGASPPATARAASW